MVPTDYHDARGRSTASNQYAVTENFRESADAATSGRNLPGVFFFYDLSPIKVRRAHGVCGRGVRASCGGCGSPLTARATCPHAPVHRPQVRIQQQRASFLHFLTNVCAIVGGIFAVSGLIDGTVYHAERVIRKKIDLGKHS